MVSNKKKVLITLIFTWPESKTGDTSPTLIRIYTYKSYFNTWWMQHSMLSRIVSDRLGEEQCSLNLQLITTSISCETSVCFQWAQNFVCEILVPVVTRFFWPPEIPLCIASPTRVSAHTSSPKICITWSKDSKCFPQHKNRSRSYMILNPSGLMS